MTAPATGPDGSWSILSFRTTSPSTCQCRTSGTNGFISSPIGSPLTTIRASCTLITTSAPHDTLSFVYCDRRQSRRLTRFPQSMMLPPAAICRSALFHRYQFRTQIGTLTWTHIFSPALRMNSASAIIATSTHQAIPSDTTSPAALGFTNVNPDDPAGALATRIIYPNLRLGIFAQGPTKLNRNTFQWADNFTWTRGKHEFKFGGGLHAPAIEFQLRLSTTTADLILAVTESPYTGSYLADFVGGFWDNYYQYSNAVYGIRTGSFGLLCARHLESDRSSHAELRASLGILRRRSTIFTTRFWAFSPGSNPPCFPTLLRTFCTRAIPARPIARSSIPTKITLLRASDSPGTCSATRKLVMRGGFGIFYDIEDGALNLQFGGLPPFAGVANKYNSGSGFAGTTGDPIADPFRDLRRYERVSISSLRKWAPSASRPFPMPTPPTRISARRIQRILTSASSGKRPRT